jgi:hypothetical protein
MGDGVGRTSGLSGRRVDGVFEIRDVGCGFTAGGGRIG